MGELLNKDSVTHAYEKLVLMAERKFLGILRAAFNENTAALVLQTLNKELLNVKKEDLANYLK